MRCWGDGPIVGWMGNQRAEGIRSYAFKGAVEADLIGASVVHNRGSNAYLRTADDRIIEETLPTPGALLTTVEDALLVTVDGTGPPEVA